MLCNFLQRVKNCKQVAEDMLERANSDPTFMKRIIMDDAMCVYEFDKQISMVERGEKRMEVMKMIKMMEEKNVMSEETGEGDREDKG